VDPTGSVDSSYNIWVTDNNIHDIGLNGVGVNSYASRISVDRNHISDFGLDAVGIVGAGIEWRGARYGTMRGNIIYTGQESPAQGTQQVDGIRIEYATEHTPQAPAYVTVVGNVVKDVSGHGVRMEGSQCVIAENVFEACDGNGIVLTAGSVEVGYNLIANNLISAAALDGVRFDGSASFNCAYNQTQGNRIVSPGSSGINVVDYSIDNTFDGDFTQNSGYIGIFEGDTNCIRNAYRDCKVLNAASGQTGIRIAGDAARVVDCESYDNRGVPLQTYGVTIAASSTNSFIDHGIFTPTATGTISDSGTGTTIR
jgi:hypothetical protein